MAVLRDADRLSSGLPAVYAGNELVAALAGCRAVVFLVGGFDGAARFGDLLQLRAAAALSEDAGALPVPVVELHHAPRGTLSTGGELTGGRCGPPLVVGPTGAPREAHPSLRPARMFTTIDRSAIYLYGGGFLNGRWGERRLAIVSAIDSLIRSAGLPAPPLLSSGLQLEPGWIERTAPERIAPLRERLPWVGVRDPRSAEAAGELSASDGAGVEALLTGDDAVGLLTPYAGDAGPADEATVRVNLNLSREEWVADDPDAAVEYAATLIGLLAGHSERPLRVQPLIAFDGGGTGEREALRRFADPQRRDLPPITIDRELVLDGRDLAGAIATLRRAKVTISCSYHVALTSLLAGVPTALLAGTDYSAQKASGLASDFEPPGFVKAELAKGPEPLAAQIAGLVTAQARPDGAVSVLRRGQERITERRTQAEGRLATELWGVVGDPDPDPRLDAVRRTQVELVVAEHQAARTIERLSAQLGAVERELEALRRSRSWRATAPLRAATSSARKALRAALIRQAEGAGGGLGAVVARTIWRLWHAWARRRQRAAERA